MESWSAKTDFGTFNIEINPVNTIDLHTRTPIIIAYNLFVGGKNRCVQINIPNNKEKPFAKLMMLETAYGDCEMTGVKIKGELTTKMTLLAFTLLKEKFPYIKYIELQDSSHHPCMIDNKEIQISLSDEYYIFYKNTLYEKRFGAYLIDKHNRQLYNNSKIHFDDPSYKPEYYNFNNNQLQEQLYPEYIKYNTWSTFFKYINDKYGTNRCQIIFPWIKDVISLLTDKNGGILSNDWMIELYDNPLIYTINYERGIEGGSVGYFNKTKKTAKTAKTAKTNKKTKITRRNIGGSYINAISFNDIVNLDYSKIFSYQ